VAARRGCEVDLYEMRAVVDGTLRSTPAHQTADFAELVCSNSLKSESENTAPWLLKQEMRRAGSPLLACADASAVPAGHALAVDRVEFSRRVAQAIEQESRITVHREEVTSLDPGQLTIVATGPLTSAALCAEIARLTGSNWRFTTPSAPSSKPTPSIWSASTSLPATTKAPPTTSIAP
jgi:methylenetetrahydrofolate--tRNA-(uracil-5-)-methyltransferase